MRSSTHFHRSPRLAVWVGAICLLWIGSESTAFAQPSNDTCPGFVITSLPYSNNGTISGAANDYGSLPSCFTGVTRDVVYTLALPCSTDCYAGLICLGGIGFMKMSIRRGGECPGTTEVLCEEDDCGDGSGNTYPFSVSPDDPHYIIIGGSSSLPGSFQLIVNGAPVPLSNDVCPGTQITALPFSDFGNTICANNDYANCVGVNSPDVVYSLVRPSCELVTVSLCGSDYDTGVEVRTDGACPGETSVACNDDNDICIGATANDDRVNSELEFICNPDQPYYIIVHGFGTHSGTYDLEVTSENAVPANDDCPGEVISSLPFSTIGYTSCATNHFVNCVGEASPDVVYQLALTECGLVTASLCGSNYDCAIEIRKDDPCPGATPIGCRDDSYCNSVYTLQSLISFVAEPGATYYLIVHGSLLASGTFVLDVTEQPCLIPPAVHDLTIYPLSGNTVHLHWSAVTPADSYYVFRGDSLDFPLDEPHRIAVVSDHQYLDNSSTLSLGQTSFYRVVATTNDVSLLTADPLLPKSSAVMGSVDSRICPAAAKTRK